MSDPPVEPRLYQAPSSKQRRLKDVWGLRNAKEQVRKYVSKFFIFNCIPANAAADVHFKNMVDEMQKVGRGVQPPTPKEILGKYLDEEVETMNKYIADMKHS